MVVICKDSNISPPTIPPLSGIVPKWAKNQKLPRKVQQIAATLSSIRQVCGNFVLSHHLPELAGLFVEIVPVAGVLPVSDLIVPESVPGRALS